MSKLLPLEHYCKLDKAAEILECDTDHLIYLAAIGSITLSLRVGSLSGYLLIGKGFGGRYIESRNDIGDINNQDPKTRITGVYSSFWSTRPDIHPSVLSETENSIAFAGNAGGLWDLPVDIINAVEANGSITITPSEDDAHLVIFSLYPTVNRPLDYSTNDVAVFMCYPTKEINISRENIWITKPNIEKVAKAKEENGTLPNIYNDTELANKASEQKRQQNPKQTRLSDSSLLASLGLMAELLAKSLPKYKYGSKPNAKQIRDSVIELATKSLGEDEVKVLQLSNLNKDINLALKLPVDETKG